MGTMDGVLGAFFSIAIKDFRVMTKAEKEDSL